MKLSDIDIRQLRVFKAVAECSGFTNAETELNISQSTISNQMLSLEGRLGVRLCERGRAGFELTEKGRSVYEETLSLFKAHEIFEKNAADLKETLSGPLRIALIDNVVTDPMCPIFKALEGFNRRDHRASIFLEIMKPGEIERAVLDSSIDVAIGTFNHRLPGLSYRKIYVEANDLYCSPRHPLYDLNVREEIEELVEVSRKVTRGYLDEDDLNSIGSIDSSMLAVVQNLEAAAVLVLGGGHIGFLPRHYAKIWVDRNEMKPLLPDHYCYHSDFSILTRSVLHQSHVLEAFLENLSLAVSGNTKTVDKYSD